MRSDFASDTSFSLERRRRRRRLVFSKFNARLLAILFLVSLLSILIICSFLLFKEARKAVITQYKTSVSSQMELIDERLSQFFNGIAKETRFLVDTPEMQSAEKEPTDPQVMNERLKPFYRLHESIGNIHLLRDDGKTFSLWPETGWDGNALSRIQLQRESVGWGHETIWLYGNNPMNEEKTIYLSQRVENHDGHSYAVLLVEIHLDKLYQWVTSLQSYKPHELMVVTPDERILLHSNPTFMGKKVHELPNYEDFSFHFGANASSQESTFSFLINDSWVHAYHQASPNSGYVYYELLQGEEIDHHLLRLRLMFFGIVILIILSVAYTFYLFWRNEDSNHGRYSPPISLAKVSRAGLDQIVRSFYLAVEMKDSYTAGHTERVAQYALAIYDQMGEEHKHLLPRDDLRYAGLLHDIGKVAIPDHILLKEGKLTKEEYERIKLHPTIGADMVEQIESLAHVSPGVRYHHERWDGRGYPKQLKGEEIPLIARILAVADTFDAMISTRSYKQAVSPRAAYEEILRCSHTQFDPNVVSFFKQAYDKGSLQVKQRDGDHP